MSTATHKKEAPKSIRCMVLTVSDTRSKAMDKSGHLIKEMLQESGHEVTAYKIVKDERQQIHAGILDGVENSRVDCILINGGTGIAKRDVTVESVKVLLDKELNGFGELFRFLSYTEDIGSAAILSRAIAGVSNNKAIFAMPGSTGAVRLAMEKLILPELGHVIREIRKDMNGADRF